MRSCKLCGSTYNIQAHHIVSRKQQPALVNCKLNLVDLCADCHVAGPNAIHNKGFVNLKKLRLEKQREYFEIFSEEFYTKDIIKDILEIRQKEVDMLLKTIVPVKINLYRKEDVIRALMGGKLLIDVGQYI